MLSVDTGIPIVPVGLVGTYGMLKKELGHLRINH